MLFSTPFAQTIARPLCICTALTASGLMSTAYAHPHVFVDASVTVRIDDKRQLAGIDYVWTFDAAYSAFASQGLDLDEDGKLSRDELAELAQVNVESLLAYSYFTHIGRNDRETGKAKGALGDSISVHVPVPQDAYLVDEDGILVLHFTIAPKEPLVLSDDYEFVIDINDPEYFVAFHIPEDNEPKLASQVACDMTLDRPKPLEEEMVSLLALIPQNGQVPEDLIDLTATQVNRLRINCG